MAMADRTLVDTLARQVRERPLRPAIRRGGRVLGFAELDDESATALKRDSHDETSCLFRDLHRAITSSRFHRCHAVTPVAIPKRVGRNS